MVVPCFNKGVPSPAYLRGKSILAMTPRIFLLLMACHLLVSVGGAVAEPILITRTDEINNVNEYHVKIPSSRWESYTWEEHIRVRCYPSGELNIGFWSGGRSSGSFFPNTRELLLKFDSEPPYTMVPNEEFDEESGTQDPKDVYSTLTPRSKAKQHSFVRKLIAHNLLLVKQEGITATTRYSLAGSAKAFAPIVSQCLGGAERIESPKSSESPHVEPLYKRTPEGYKRVD